MKNYKHLKVDLSNCDKEPIHIIGRIQAHGFLLIIDADSRIIRQVSENIEELTGFSPDQCLNSPLEQIFPEEALREINASLAAGSSPAPFPVRLQEKHFIYFLHHSTDRLLLEFEPAMNYTLAGLNRLHSFLGESLRELSQQETLPEISAFTARQIQALLDYDRVMIYQFDEDWHGNVIAEAVKKGVRSYYNHHFPASDIPQQAREMLMKKEIRQIPGVDAESIEIIPYFHPVSGSPTDINTAELRNPSEIHLEYLKNMEVGATLSIAIIVRAKLWGLVCCHHHSPLFIDYYQRNVAQLITRYFAAAILSAREAGEQALLQKYAAVERTLVAQMEEHLNITEGLFSKPVSLLDLSAATGAAILLEDKVVTRGECPSEKAIREMADWASQQALPGVFYTREFHKHYPAAFEYKEAASGVMILEISKHTKEYIFCFKPEIKEKISWAGNPDKSLQMDAQQKLHPRKSFEKWEQEIQGKSAPWSGLEAERAGSLIKSVASIQLKCQAEKLKELNLHLEDFTRIASHNLFAPLNNIVALVGLYKRKADFPTAQLALEKIDTVSGNMRQTLQDLHEVLKIATSGELPKEYVAIGPIIDKEKQSLAAQIQETHASIQTDLQVSGIFYPKVHVESIIHNFLSNALKYRSPERKPEIRINAREENDKILLEITDNGLGINLQKHGHRLFGLYKTIHHLADSRGMGLYLVKKQVEALGGTIRVESQEGKGTRFTVLLKKFEGQSAGETP